MYDFNTIEDTTTKIKSDLDNNSDKKKIVLIYAFNGTGKTRLSTAISNAQEDNTLSYDAFFEDLFTWDNETYTLKFVTNSKIINFIQDQGLENQITDNFQRLIETRIQPNYDFINGNITFNFTPGDNRTENNIKISRGEETIFIWSIYFTFLEAIISLLNEAVDDRETQDFNNVEYVIIDDPVSSIDDSKIISMTIDLINAIDSSINSTLKFLITTHHPLFFNIMFNEYEKKKGYKHYPFLLSKTNSGLRLEEQRDTPFGYHLFIKNKIKEAIDSNNIEKYHFNLFRALLEKTSTYLGYKNWHDCLRSDTNKEFSRLLNIYSHGKLSDLESKNFPETHKELFIEVFDTFIQDYKWKI